MVPGLKKMDKASVLGAAIKYVRMLEEQVKGMEEQVAQQGRQPVVEAAVLANKSRLAAAQEDQESLVGLPQIEARMSSNRTVLLRIHCENRKGVLVATLCVVEGNGLTVINAIVVPFTEAFLDITIIARADCEDLCFSAADDIVMKLYQAFMFPPPRTY